MWFSLKVEGFNFILWVNITILDNKDKHLLAVSRFIFNNKFISLFLKYAQINHSCSLAFSHVFVITFCIYSLNKKGEREIWWFQLTKMNIHTYTKFLCYHAKKDRLISLSFCVCFRVGVSLLITDVM